MSRARLVAIIMGLCVIGDSMLYVTLPPSFQQLGLDATTTGLILSVNRFSRLAFNPLAAVVILRLGYRKTATLASCLAVVCTAGYAVASTAPVWLALRVVWGLVWSLIRLVAFLVTLEECTQASKGQALGTMQRLVRIGSTSGTLGGGLLLDHIGFRNTSALFGAVTVLAVFLAMSLKDRPAGGDSSPGAAAGVGTAAGRGAARETGVASGAGVASGSVPAGNVAARPKWRERVAGLGRAVVVGLPVYASALGVAIAVGGVFLSTVGVMLKARFGDAAAYSFMGIALGVGSVAGFMQSFRRLSDIVLSPYVGRLSDRVGRSAPMAAILGVEFLAGWVLLGSSSLPAVIAAGIVLFSAHSAVLVVLSSAAADYGRERGAATPMTIYSTCLDAGDAVGPVFAYSLLGFGIDKSYGVGVAIVGLMALVWSMRVVWSGRRRRAGGAGPAA
ncbi:MAG: MFS transporter [Bacillota bacterium]|nr:MFS transporter [Bacillota bacterium]